MGIQLPLLPEKFQKPYSCIYYTGYLGLKRINLVFNITVKFKSEPDIVGGISKIYLGIRLSSTLR
jgi:hypothetical protein